MTEQMMKPSKIPCALWLCVAMLAVVLFGGISGCDRVTCADENSRAALRNLNANGTWMYVFDNDTEATFQHVEKQILATRLWAETLPDYCERKAYLDWMDYATRQIAKARASDPTRSERVKKAAEEMTKPPVYP